MLRVNLTVLEPAALPTGHRGEDWGEWDFSSLPQAGDHIEMERNDRKETLQVRRVIHFAAQHPLPRATFHSHRCAKSECRRGLSRAATAR